MVCSNPRAQVSIEVYSKPRAQVAIEVYSNPRARTLRPFEATGYLRSERAEEHQGNN